jgi:hypothetical protein
MKIQRILILGFSIFAASGIILCNIETASGPTPYETFTGETKSLSNLEIGKGTKTLVVNGSLPILVESDSGQLVTISANADTAKKMQGHLKSYSIDNGNMVVDVNVAIGSGNYKDWKVVLGGKGIVDSAQKHLDSVKQAYTNLGFGMFLHFNMSTFDRNNCEKCYSVSGEWGLANRDPKIFRPSALNCGQWADVAKSAGCKYMVLTTKHHDGFCIWPSNYTEYCVRNASVTTDVCKAFVDSARSRGMRIGFYYSIRDLTNGYQLSFIKNQLSELLTNYGEVICLWFDGWGWGPGYKAVPYDSVRALIKSIQPNCLIVENNHEFNTSHSEMIEYEMPIDGPPALSNKLPAEGNEPIRIRTQFEPLWFWHPIGNCDIKTPESIVAQLKQNNDRNAAYLLDLTPDTSGLIPECQAAVMKQVGVLRGIAQ